MKSKWSKRNGKNATIIQPPQQPPQAGATQSQGGASASTAQAQRKKPATASPSNLNQMEWSAVAGELAKAQVKTSGRVDKLEAAVDALMKGEGPKPDEGKVVNAYRYYPGGDKSKPLANPTLDYWIAVQAADYKVEFVYLVKARLYGDGRLVALSPEEAAKYA